MLIVVSTGALFLCSFWMYHLPLEQDTSGLAVLAVKWPREQHERSPKPCRYNNMVISKTYLITPVYPAWGLCALCILQSFLWVSLSYTCPFLGDKLQAACWRQCLCFQSEEHPSGGWACIKGIQLLGRSRGFSLFFTLPGQKGKKPCNTFCSSLYLPTWNTELRGNFPFLMVVTFFLSGTKWQNPLGDAQLEPMRDLPLMSTQGWSLTSASNAVLTPVPLVPPQPPKNEIVPWWEEAWSTFPKCSGEGLALQKEGQS